MPGPSRQDKDVATVDLEAASARAAEDDDGRPGDDPEHLVRGGVKVLERIDPVHPFAAALSYALGQPVGPVQLTRLTIRPSRLQVEDRCAVDRLERANVQPRRRPDRRNGHAMQADRVWAVGGASCEHTGQRRVRVSSWVSLEDVSIGQVKPGEQEEVLPCPDVMQCSSRRVVGWQLAGHMRTTLVLDAPSMALSRREPGADVELVHHSDAGGQHSVTAAEMIASWISRSCALRSQAFRAVLGRANRLADRLRRAVVRLHHPSGSRGSRHSGIDVAIERVAYDAEAVAAEIRAVGLPEELAEKLPPAA